MDTYNRVFFLCKCMNNKLYCCNHNSFGTFSHRKKIKLSLLSWYDSLCISYMQKCTAKQTASNLIWIVLCENNSITESLACCDIWPIVSSWFWFFCWLYICTLYTLDISPTESSPLSWPMTIHEIYLPLMLTLTVEVSYLNVFHSVYDLLGRSKRVLVVILHSAYQVAIVIVEFNHIFFKSQRIISINSYHNTMNYL